MANDKFSVYRDGDPDDMRKTGDFVKGPYMSRSRAQKVAAAESEKGGSYAVHPHGNGPLARDFNNRLYRSGGSAIDE